LRLPGVHARPRQRGGHSQGVPDGPEVPVPGAESRNAAANLYYKTFTDPVKFINGQAYYSKAEAWAKAMECLMGWNDKDASGADVKFGPAHSWGPDTVLVIDSLSGLSQYALNYHQQMNGGLMKEPCPQRGAAAGRCGAEHAPSPARHD
jgi:hypothetical protein